MTLTTKIQSNVVPTFRSGAPIIPKKWSIRYNTQAITTVSNKVLCPSKPAHSILDKLRTAMSSRIGVQTRGFSTSFHHVKLSFRLGEPLSRNHDKHDSNESNSLLWVVATSNSPNQLLLTNKSRKELRLELHIRRYKHEELTTIFSKSAKKTQVVRIRH